MTPAIGPHDTGFALDTLGQALARTYELDEALMAAIAAEQRCPYGDSACISASVSAACVALEHGRALGVLVAQGLPTAALSVLRLRHEALTRAVWLLYAATDLEVDKFTAPLSKEPEANKLPMLANKAVAAQPLLGLQALKDNNSPALNSFVHVASTPYTDMRRLPRAAGDRCPSQLQRPALDDWHDASCTGW